MALNWLYMFIGSFTARAPFPTVQALDHHIQHHYIQYFRIPHCYI